jgi:hypothetical protein
VARDQLFEGGQVAGERAIDEFMVLLHVGVRTRDVTR